MFKRYPSSDKRQVINYNRFLELTGTKIFICLDKGVLEIARYFLNSRALWPTSYSVEYQESGYITPTKEQMDFLSEIIAEANLDMASCEDIVTALEGIQGAIEATSTTSGSSGCCIGDGTQDVTEINEPTPETTPPRDGDPPAGFSTWEEYDEFKCNAIGWFLDNYIGTLRNWAGLFGIIGGLTLAVIVGVTLLSLPLVALVAALAALGSIVGIDIGLLVNFANIADDLEAERDTLKCDMFNVDNAGDAFDIISAAVEASISGLSLPPGVDLFFSVACTQLNSTESLNIIYSGQGDIDDHTGEDCSECGSETAAYEVVVGTEISTNPANPILLETEAYTTFCSNGQRALIVWEVEVTVTEILVNGAPSGLGGCGQCGTPEVFQYYGPPGTSTFLGQTNARPQDDTPFSGVTGLEMLPDCDGSTAEIEVHYTVD